MLDFPMFFVFPLAMVVAAAMDMLTMTIPNRICLAIAGAFVIATPLAGLPLDQFFSHSITGAGMLAITIGMFSLGWMGGGDAKLLSAAALWVGSSHLIIFIAHVAIAGGLLSVALLAYRSMPALVAMPMPDWALRLHRPGYGAPYGIAIAAGALSVYPQLPWFTAFGG